MGLFNKTLSDDMLIKINDYWNAANYLSACQLYLLDNPLLRRKLTIEDIKPTLVGHWGTAPGQNFIYVHLNRIINKYDLNMIYVSGPGHGGQALIANSYLEGYYSEIYTDITEDIHGLRKLFKQFSFPGGVQSHVAPDVPGSINEGGELGYSLAHSFGAVLDNPDLMVACVIGDGEAETGPLAASWQIIRTINPKTDGVVLPILHLNGYKIANPTLLSRIPEEQLESYLRGCGWEPYYVEGSNPLEMHEKMATALERVMDKIRKVKTGIRDGKTFKNIEWPMIVLRTPKGWTAPKFVNDMPIEGNFRSHQIPIGISKDINETVDIIESWLKSYHPEKLFDKNGKLRKDLRELSPKGNRRMSANIHANGGLLLQELKLPNIEAYAVDVKEHGKTIAEDMRELGKYVGDVIKLNPNNFRTFSPDEAKSNRLYGMFNYTNRAWNLEQQKYDDCLSPNGRIMDSILSEHVCEGMLEGYLLTGRHGFFDSYEAFIRIVDSMVSQHAKWLKMCNEISWRKDISSLNLILTSHVWQQDHNGYTHQDPGFLNHIVTKKADVVRVYLPYDANSLLSVYEHTAKSKNYINVIVASKHPRPQWLNMKDTIEHCKKGISEWKWASTCDSNPQLIMACCGDTPTLETLAAVSILRDNFPKLKIRVINVVDLMKLQSHDVHPHGLTDKEWEQLFPKEVPVIFAFHGYPSLIHELTYKRSNNDNMHVHGYTEEGTITTPFDMRVINKIDRYHLVIDALKYLKIKNKAEVVKKCEDKLTKHYNYIRTYGKDIKDVRDFKWKDSK